MSDNPYTPPNSRVDECVLPWAQQVRPGQVLTALWLGAATCAEGLVVQIVSRAYDPNVQATGLAIAFQVFLLVLSVWVYYKIYAGRNWARVTLLVLFVVGPLLDAITVLYYEMFLGVVIAMPVIAKVQLIVKVLLDLAILWLLFISPGRHWFRRVSKPLVA